ncbi:MAG TPA: response regulator [Pirellulales bacterium]|nr:response regulator [Pirellulales bacterium]
MIRSCARWRFARSKRPATRRCAEDGQAAVCLFEQHPQRIGLALLDVVMPQLNGRHAYQRMIAVRPELPVIFCTGHDPTTDQAPLFADERQRFLQKPFSSAALLRAVRELLDAHQPRMTRSNGSRA